MRGVRWWCAIVQRSRLCGRGAVVGRGGGAPKGWCAEEERSGGAPTIDWASMTLVCCAGWLERLGPRGLHWGGEVTHAHAQPNVLLRQDEGCSYIFAIFFLSWEEFVVGGGGGCCSCCGCSCPPRGRRAAGAAWGEVMVGGGGPWGLFQEQSLKSYSLYVFKHLYKDLRHKSP